MASLSGVSSSNTISSLMNSANMISGLASGLDTESMIESLVKSYQTKIGQLNQKVTKVEWKQEAYRSIISKMVGFSSKYTSYASSTNLMSLGLFNNAVKVLAKGEYADRVSASGKASSDIKLDAVHQLAKAAQYRTKSNLVTSDAGTISGKEVDLFTQNPDEQFELSNLSGSLTLTYGAKTISLNFSEVTDVEAMNDIRRQLAKEQGYGRAEDVSDADVLAELINRKLADEQIVFNSGNVESANQRISASAYGNAITFSELGSGNNGVYISGASGNIAKQLGLNDDDLKDAAEKKPVTLDVGQISDGKGGSGLTRKLNGIEYLAEKSSASSRIMTLSLDGTTKQITLPSVSYNEKSGMWSVNGYDVSKDEFTKRYTQALQYSVKEAFGDKVTVENKGEDGNLQLEFKVKNDGSELIINSAVGDALGIGIISSSYLNTGDTLGDLMGTDGKGGLKGLTAVQGWDFETGEYYDRTDEKGNKLYEFVINGVTIGNYTKDTSLSTILSDINSNADAGVQVAYSTATQSFTFTAKETGADSGITLGGGLAEAMFGVDYSGKKITDVLGGDTISNQFSFKIGDQSFSGKIDNNSETMDSLVKKLNDEVLKSSGYTASYSAKDGLVVKDAKGKQVELDYGNGGNVLRDIMEKAKPDPVLEDHHTDKLTDILGQSIKGKTLSFTVKDSEGEHDYSYDFVGNGATVDMMVSAFNKKIREEGGKYTVSYAEDTGLVIKDQDGNKVEAEYNEMLGKIADEVAVKYNDHSQDKLTKIYGKDIVDEKKLNFEFTIGEGEDAQTFSGKLDSSDATMDDLLKAINNKLPSGYKASYADQSGRLVIKDGNGKEVKVSYNNDSENNIMRDVMQKVDNRANYTEGQDAKFTVTINGEQKNMTRSTNNVTLDGLTITMEDTFNSKQAEGGSYGFEVDEASKSVSFQSKTDSDKLIDLIKGMVNDYNTMMSEIKSAYMTMPYQNSNGSFANYEPLTDEDREGMSESAIERYEEKAKQGILFGDRTLSALYTKLNQAFSFTNKADVDTLKEMGISVSYNVNDGAQAVSIDEDKLRAMLDNDPDRVANLFTKTDGIMDRMKSQLDIYARTTGEPKGILIQQAGSPLSSLSLMNNTWQNEIDNYTTQIEKWQSKLQTQVERYTSQFARLEQLIAQMNNQSSTLAGLMGS